MKKVKVLIGALIALALSMVLIGCGEVSVAKRSAQGTYIAAVSVDEGISIKRDLAAQGEISPDGELRVTRALLTIDRSLLQVTDTAECFAAYTADARATLIRGVEDGITALDQLNGQGVIQFKSEKAQRRFTIAITALRGGLVALKTNLALLPAREPQANGSTETQLSDKERQTLEQVRELCRSASKVLRQNEQRLTGDLARLDTSHSG